MALTRRAIAAAPSYAFGHFAQGACYTILGRFDEALKCFDAALHLDPLSLRVIRGMAWTLSAAGRFEEAERRARSAIELEPNSAEPYYMAALIYLHQRRIGQALECIREGHRGSPTPLARGLEGAILAASGDRAGAERILEELEAYADWVDPIISRIYLELGDSERALEQMGRSIEERSPLAPYVATDPLYARLRGDRRFGELIAPLKLPKRMVSEGSLNQRAP